MTRVPIRVRLTVAFASAMAVVFAVTGLFLYHHLATSLDRTLAQRGHYPPIDISKSYFYMISRVGCICLPS